MRTKTYYIFLIILTVSLSLSISGKIAIAGLSHYVPGTLGVKNSSCPPPGLWYIGYNQYYTADTYKDDNGNTSTTTDVDATIIANVNQFILISEKKILGANYGADLFVSLVHTDLNVKVGGQRSRMIM